MALTPIVFFIALECEARPLIDLWKLKKIDQIGLIKRFANKNITIMITGVGAKNMYLASGFFIGKNPSFRGHFINFGIGGHANLPLGHLCMINHVTKEDLSSSYYLNPISSKKEPFFSCMSVATLKAKYHENFLYDMEAFSFTDALSTFHPIDSLHVIKIISDNSENSYHQIKPKIVIELVDQQKKELDKILTTLPQLEEDKSIALLESFLKMHPLSESEQILAKKYFEKCIALNIPINLNEIEDFQALKSFVFLRIENRFGL